MERFLYPIRWLLPVATDWWSWWSVTGNPFADTIVVMENGRITAQGPHQRLLEESPAYRKLYELQFRTETPA